MFNPSGRDIVVVFAKHHLALELLSDFKATTHFPEYSGCMLYTKKDCIVNHRIPCFKSMIERVSM